MKSSAPATTMTAAADRSLLGAPRHALALFDSIAAALALVASAYWALSHASREPLPRMAHIIALTLLGLLVLLLLFRDGQYSLSRRLSRLDDSASVLKNVVFAYLLTVGLVFATKGFFTNYSSLSRMAFLIDLAVLALLMLAIRVGLHAYEVARLRRGVGLTRALIIGAGTSASDLAQFVGRRPWLGVTCVGRLSPSGDADTGSAGHDRGLPPCVGSVDDVQNALDAHQATQVIVALDAEEIQHLPRVTGLLTRAGIAYRFVPALFEHSYHSAKLAGLAELPVMDMEVDALDRAQRTTKRVLDLVLATGILVLGSPVWVAAALAVTLTSRGPILFRQERVGCKGRHFDILKFRTMTADAEERLVDLADENEADGHLFKIKADPRVTPVGRFLRRWSIDEIPQMLNVLRGEMSVVGPRPPLPAEVAQYETEHLCRLKGTPGITGLWQVSGRSDLSFEEMVKLDRFYLENWTIGLDFKILLRTAYVVLGRKGAY